MTVWNRANSRLFMLSLTGMAVLLAAEEPGTTRIALADNAIAEGGMEYVIAHGVERGPEIKWGYRDFWAWKLADFKRVLDELALRRDRGELWITDHISCHKYKTERETDRGELLQRTHETIVLELSRDADGELYDLPLTLMTRVPESWKNCRIIQERRSTTVKVTNGVICYGAPAGKITISNLKNNE